MDKNKIAVLLIDDFTLFGEALSNCFLYSDQIHFLGIIPNDESAATLMCDYNADIILMDIAKLKRQGMQHADAIIKQAGAGKVVGLSMSYEQAVINEFINSGGKGFISKYCSLEKITEAITKINKGETVIACEQDQQ